LHVDVGLSPLVHFATFHIMYSIIYKMYIFVYYYVHYESEEINIITQN